MTDNTKQSRGQQSFIYGALILMCSTAIVKVIGAIFKIPLASIIGGLGMGYFTTAYDLFTPIYTLAMAGLPVAISRVVAERMAEKRYRDVHVTLKVVRRAFFVTGGTGFLIMLALSYPFVKITHNEGSLLSVIVIAPSLLFCCIMSTYRGYYEGFKNMYPTAVSSVIEAMGKLIIGYSAALIVLKAAQNEFAASGTVFGQLLVVKEDAAEAVRNAAAPYASAAAIFGITVGSALGALYLLIKYKKKGDNISPEMLSSSENPLTSNQTLKIIVAIAVPVVLGSLTTQVSSLIDVTMVQRQLGSVVQSSADQIRAMYGSNISAELKDSDIPSYLYGCYKGFAYSIYNLVPTITQVLGVSAIPALATAWTKKRYDEIKSNTETILKISALIAIPCGLGIASIPGGILRLLYSATRSGEIAIATPMLVTLGITSAFSGMMVPMTNMLQSIGRQTTPVKNIAVGAALKIIINYVLVGIPSVNIMGAAVGTLVCYIYIFAADLYCLLKYSKVKLNVFGVFMKPLIAGAGCAVTAFLVSFVISRIVHSAKLTAVIAIAAAALIYFILLFVVKALSYDDIASIPKAGRLAERLKSRGWIA